MKRIVLPPYDSYDLSTFVITDNIIHIGHFGGFCNEKGELLNSIEEQMFQTLNNLENKLLDIGLDRNSIVKLNVLLKNINDFKGMHNSWISFFNEGIYPVRTVVTTEFVSKQCLVQIEGIAYLNNN